MEAIRLTRQERRASRLKRLVTSRDAHRAALEAGLDYRVSGESGAIVIHTHTLTWHRAKSPNITVPPPGRGWDRSGRARKVEAPQGSVAEPPAQHLDGRHIAGTNTIYTTE